MKALGLEVPAAVGVLSRLVTLHHGLEDLEKGIRAWIAAWNTSPKPYVRAKTADEILERIASYPNRITDSED
ncbi:hypothetical protein M2162_009006 [Streptomyces sp. SAI-041]|nr:hypothetical protein [Streptomyces sp. SAI-041]